MFKSVPLDRRSVKFVVLFSVLIVLIIFITVFVDVAYLNGQTPAYIQYWGPITLLFMGLLAMYFIARKRAGSK